MGETRNACKILVGKPDVGGWTIFKMDLREIGWDGRDWIDLARDRDQWRTLVNTLMNLHVH
jgi:hypothetical protein